MWVYAVSKPMDQLLERLNMKLKICREYNVIGKVGAVAAQIQKHTTRRPCLCKMENKSDQGFGKSFVVWGLKLTFFCKCNEPQHCQAYCYKLSWFILSCIHRMLPW